MPNDEEQKQDQPKQKLPELPEHGAKPTFPPLEEIRSYVILDKKDKQKEKQKEKVMVDL